MIKLLIEFHCFVIKYAYLCNRNRLDTVTNGHKKGCVTIAARSINLSLAKIAHPF